MATPRRSSPSTAVPRSRAVRKVVLVLIGLAALAVSTPPAQAAPEPATAGDAATLMAARAHDLEKLTESFDAARDELAAQQAKAHSAQAAYQQAQAALVTARRQVRGIARSAYTGDSSSFAALIGSRSATEFVDRVSTLETIAGRQGAVLGQVQTVSDAAAQAEAAAQKAVAQAKATFDAVRAQQTTLQAQITTYQAAFNRLTAQEKQAALAGETDRASRSADRTALPPAGPSVAPSQAAQTAVNTALAQRGKPYVWGAAGPESFDCSGLTQYAYAAAGVSLPHSSAMQARMGRAVTMSQLAPGDLVFYYSPISHVGIYIGNGQIVNAPTSGDVVKITGVTSVGAPTALRRIVG
jgi:cell wall-associated NlpC family hydrolase